MRAKVEKLVKPNYYSIQFSYPGPKGLFASDANRVLVQADILVEEALEAVKLDFRHQYAWPDGSLYKYVRTSKTAEEVWTLLNAKLAESIGLIGGVGIKAETVTPIPEDNIDILMRWRQP